MERGSLATKHVTVSLETHPLQPGHRVPTSSVCQCSLKAGNCQVCAGQITRGLLGERVRAVTTQMPVVPQNALSHPSSTTSPGHATPVLLRDKWETLLVAFPAPGLVHNTKEAGDQPPPCLLSALRGLSRGWHGLLGSPRSPPLLSASHSGHTLSVAHTRLHAAVEMVHACPDRLCLNPTQACLGTLRS